MSDDVMLALRTPWITFRLHWHVNHLRIMFSSLFHAAFAFILHWIQRDFNLVGFITHQRIHANDMKLSHWKHKLFHCKNRKTGFVYLSSSINSEWKSGEKRQKIICGNKFVETTHIFSWIIWSVGTDLFVEFGIDGLCDKRWAVWIWEMSSIRSVARRWWLCWR